MEKIDLQNYRGTKHLLKRYERQIRERLKDMKKIRKIRFYFFLTVNDVLMLEKGYVWTPFAAQ